MSEPAASPPARTSRLSTLALSSAVLGFTCFPIIGGVLAIALGVAAKTEIAGSAGQLGGKRLATFAIAMGAISTLVFSVSFVTLLARMHQWPNASAAAPPVAVAPVKPLAPTPTPQASGSAEPPAASRDVGLVTTKVGSIELVDLGSQIPSLIEALTEQRAHAAAEQQKLLVWLVVPDCQPCNGVSAALPDPLMQRALAKTRLLRLDLREFGAELTHLGVPVEREDGSVVVPAFVLLDDNNRALDYVHGGEWDADIAQNIAPVLGGFVRGKYEKRRHPWHRGHRSDGVTL